jgi:hypothetical protein
MPVFSDGFESGDFSAWTGTLNGPAVSNVVVHTGVWSFGVRLADLFVFCYKALDANIDEFYARVYIYPDTLSLSVNGQFFDIIRFESLTGVNACKACIHRTAGVNYFALRVTGGSFVDSATVAAVDSWYCVELHYKKNVVCEIWVDGANTSSAGANVQVGRYTCAYTSSLNNNLVYFDDYVGDTAQIGGISSRMLRRLLVGVGL